MILSHRTVPFRCQSSQFERTKIRRIQIRPTSRVRWVVTHLFDILGIYAELHSGLHARRDVFFTVVAYQRQPLLTKPAVRRALRQAIQRVRTERPFSIEAVVLLPDHMHMI